MNLEKKNLPESVYSRLKTIALAKNCPTQEVLTYYAMERFLYRLSEDFLNFYVAADNPYKQRISIS